MHALFRRAGTEGNDLGTPELSRRVTSPQLLIPQKGPVPPRGFSFEPFPDLPRRM